MRKDNKTYYDEFSQGYEKERFKRYHRFLDESELSIARPYCEGKRVLEVGCGTGLLLAPLAEVAESAVGIDLSEGMLAKAKERGLTVKQASATSLPFSDSSFDTVVSFKVLAHVEEIQKALHEAVRVTRPGGHLVLEFYNKHSVRSLVKLLKPAHSVADSTTDEQVYTRFDSLSDIASYLPSGAQIVKVAGIRVLAPTYHFYNAPLLGTATVALERRLQNSALARLGGFLVVVVQKAG